MCGIFAYFGDGPDISELQRHYQKIQHRGPDFSTIQQLAERLVMGFHRLSIVGLNEQSNQPLVHKDRFLVCNGEIFNYHHLVEKYDYQVNTDSDCEVILHLYDQFGIDETVKQLDGEFAFVLYDQGKLYAARDPVGIRPLFYLQDDTGIYFCSEYKGLPTGEERKGECFPPGHMYYAQENRWDHYHPFPAQMDTHLIDVQTAINYFLTEGVKKRFQSDRPVGCLLSGGLDSSLIVAIAHKYQPNIPTFSIGLEGGVDLAAARDVVDYLNLQNHHEVTFTVEEGIQAIRQVIYHLESFDITTVRASTPQYLLAKYIQTQTDIRVLLSGEGSDEIFAGYQYSKMAPDSEALEADLLRLLRELYMFDVLRTDRTMAAFGLEVRVPFLDLAFLELVMNIDGVSKMCGDKIEKKILRDAFAGMLPESVLYRSKAAFSDAVSSPTQSWYESIKEYAEAEYTDWELVEAQAKYTHCPPFTKEALLYREIFEEFYPEQSHLIKHFWMPQFQTDQLMDPSATVLTCFHESKPLSPSFSSPSLQEPLVDCTQPSAEA